MAQLVLRGDYHTVTFGHDEDGLIVATCLGLDVTPGWPDGPPCPWTERYDTLDDATQYAADHADRGR